MARHAAFLGEDGDLGQVLRDHAEEDVVADLHDTRELALADIAHTLAQRLHIGERLVDGRLVARGDDAETAGLDHLGVAAHGRVDHRGADLGGRSARRGGGFR